MKKVIYILLACFLLTSISIPAFAAQKGSAIIPHINANHQNDNNYARFIIALSNITSNTITVTITLYDDSGNVIQDGDDSISGGNLQLYTGGTVTNYNDDPTGASVSFDLASSNTVEVHLKPTSLKIGYGVISWSSTSTTRGQPGLVANGTYYYRYVLTSSGYAFQGQYSIPINMGLPF